MNYVPRGQILCKSTTIVSVAFVGLCYGRALEKAHRDGRHAGRRRAGGTARLAVLVEAQLPPHAADDIGPITQRPPQGRALRSFP